MSKSVEEIQDFIIAKIAELQEVDKEKIDVTKTFSSFGLDSVTMLQMSGDVEEWLGVKIDPMALFEYATIERLSEYLAK